MKKVAIVLGLILASAIGFSQSKVVKDAKGNYKVEKAVKITSEDSLLGKTMYLANGDEYPLYVSKNGKYYIKRVSKSGNEYKQYFKLDN